ncbi:TPA: DNA adenine methylase, partial [Escherichia coli]|nr:DNA adenine methylase [Escherichia coli]
VKPKCGYFWNEFSCEGNPQNSERPRNYFSPENARKLDGIREVINNLSCDNILTDLERSLLLHDLIMAANDIANIAGTYGHYMSRLNGRALTQLNLKCTDLLLKSDVENHIVMQGYAEENASKIQCDLCYIDPPYMKRQYAANYHILETLARGDEPEAIGISGLRPWRDQYSNFCTKTKIRDSFKEIITNMGCNEFLISYSEDGLLTIEDFNKLLADFG